jgi:hypothetical protein
MKDIMRVCAVCNAIIVWRGALACGQWRHMKPGKGDILRRLYITTHAPEPAPQYETN